MAEKTRGIDRFIMSTTNVCCCLSGAVLVLVSANSFTRQNSETIAKSNVPPFAQVAVRSTDLAGGARSELKNLDLPSQLNAALTKAPPPKKNTQVASIGDTSLGLSSHNAERQTAPVLPWGAHLTASWTREKALTQYSEIQSRFPGVLSGKAPMVVRLTNHSMGNAERFAVRIGQPDRDKAEKLCTRLIQAGGACVVYKTRRR
ncbi:MAG: hypothetical protein HKN05_08570 [Rhizobiales bacterium]|nr:hypothetical protein [Hyphomicrobiales bacterium]